VLVVALLFISLHLFLFELCFSQDIKTVQYFSFQLWLNRHLNVFSQFLQVARVGQSATLVGSRVILFGGEDRSRKLLNDVHVLDLESMTWDMIKTS
jgi:N-acetylneuraminic acid mutarotase